MESGTRPTRQQANVVRDLVKGHSQSTQCARELDESVVSALDGEFVGCGYKRQAGKPGYLGRCRLGKTRRRVDSRSHSRAPERETINPWKGSFDAVQTIRQDSHIAGPFLAQCQRGCVLHMGTADLDDV